jgi:hypothetical protein
MRDKFERGKLRRNSGPSSSIGILKKININSDAASSYNGIS